MDELKPLVQPVSKTDIVLYEGTTTENGNVGRTTLIDASLIGSNDFLTGVTIYITSGAADLETQNITGFNPVDGTITVGTAFSAQIVAGVSFKVLVFGAAAADLAALLEVQDVVIYPVSEHAGTTEITDDGSSPAYYADTECGVATLENAPNVHWLEDVNFEQAGTITIISVFLEFEWQHKTAGGTAYSKIQMSGDGGATWIDVTDSIAEVNVAYQIKKRMGVGNFVATITAGVNQLQFRLVSWEAAGNSSCCKIRSNSYVRITHRKS